MAENTGIRLQKYLAERGLASRRGAGDVIRAGRVTVDGQVVIEPGWRVDPDRARITLDGRNLDAGKAARRTLMLNKPRGYVCSRSATQGRTVFELLRGVNERVVPVGRLDKDSEGLLLLSDDGALVHRLTHPRFGLEKAYEVTVSGTVDPAALATLRTRLVIDGYSIQPVRVRRLGTPAAGEGTVLEFILKEGRNRQIRHMCTAAGLTVRRLVRVRVKSLVLGGLRPGQWRDLTLWELANLEKPFLRSDAQRNSRFKSANSSRNAGGRVAL